MLRLNSKKVKTVHEKIVVKEHIVQEYLQETQAESLISIV